MINFYHRGWCEAAGADCPILVPAVVYPSCVHEGKTLPVVYCLTVRKDLFTGSWIFEVLHSKAGKNLVSKLIWHNLLIPFFYFRMCFGWSAVLGYKLIILEIKKFEKK
ncbi:hypothetical protein T4A_4183 [Trichinella pseudospiralis]|uniref:Uncharacterized protein n=1 Tax=Trichinella pseudospiralis TaxID=6337 RepID=A0A0V1DSK8_TRIPS|nr:hypothetical protein T4A_4183 [Trichinella pseudospiralis]